MISRVIYYYQTFITIEKILKEKPTVTHIHLSSIHFGYDDNNAAYIHLNDNDPYDKIFDNVWKELTLAYNLGIKIVLMIGGAGGGYFSLFNNFSVFYKLLFNLIKNKSIIQGIDLDIEENVELNNVKMLINNINNDFIKKNKNFILTMAPIQSSMESDQPGMGGFIYKDLYNSPQGKLISYFNVQCYYDYSVEAFDNMVNNKYPPEKIVMGMISSEDFKNCVKVASILSNKYKNFGGVFNWEYFDSPPDSNNPGEWADLMYHSINNLKLRRKNKKKCFICC